MICFDPQPSEAAIHAPFLRFSPLTNMAMLGRMARPVPFNLPTARKPTSGELIHHHRVRLGWGQEELATKLGVTPQTVSRDERKPDLKTGKLKQYAMILGVRLQDLLPTDDDRDVEERQLVDLFRDAPAANRRMILQLAISLDASRTQDRPAPAPQPRHRARR